MPDPGPRTHVLLVGIDDYKISPLNGCVNDIDAVQRILLSPRVGITADRITRLASPQPGTSHETTVPEQPATLARLRDALAALGSDQVAAGDRVFIYYSGHGARAPFGTGARRFHREALVPVDFTGELRDLLFDHELNQLLRRITARTRAVTFVLDCCHAGGVTREVVAAPDQRSRFIDLTALLAKSGPLDPAIAGGAGVRGLGDDDAGALGHGVDDCHVIAACQGHEVANESRGEDGVQHGALTRVFIDALERVTERDLGAVRWARIWYGMCADLARRSAGQNPWMTASAARTVFAGPPVAGDPGFAVVRDGQGYRIEAGTVADVTPGTVLAIYGDTPDHFPPLDTPADLAARLGKIRVTTADPGAATAVLEGAPFDLPPGARGRIVQLGSTARLRFAVIPPTPEIETAIATSPLLERAAPDTEPDVRLERSDDRWFVTDRVHGRAGEPLTLFALPPSGLGAARAVLEHYHLYTRPLRVAAAASDLPGSLSLQVLACPTDHELSPAEAQAADLSEAPSRAAGSYQVKDGTPVCIRVSNDGTQRLRVALVNAGASGRVQQLGDQIIDGKTQYVFWLHGELGAPFEMELPTGVDRCADRLVAIGTTAVDRDLGYLAVDTSFADIAGGVKDKDFATPRAPVRWTSAQAVIITER